MTQQQMSQGFTLINGFPQYISMYITVLQADPNNPGKYDAWNGNWSLFTKYNEDRHLVVSERNNWQLQKQVGKYVTPITFEQAKQLNQCVH